MVTHVPEPTAADFMSDHVVTATPEMGIEQLSEYLIAHGVASAPVVLERDGRQELVGFISERECLEYLSNELFYSNPDATVGAMMRRHPVCVGPDADVFALASIFIQHGYRHLPVVDGQYLVGFVSRGDVLRGLLEYYQRVSQEQEEARHPPDLSEIANIRFMAR